MIVCSCNVLSDTQVKSVASGSTCPRMSRVYAALGCTAKCGRCTHTIKTILDGTGHHVALDHCVVAA